jgi:hypothetical protein
VGELKAMHQEHLGEITKASLVAESPQDDEEHDFCWELHVIERCSGSLVEGALAICAGVDLIVKRSLHNSAK